MKQEGRYLRPLYSLAQNISFRGSNSAPSSERKRCSKKTTLDYEFALIEAMKSFFENDFEVESLKEALAQIRNSGLSTIPDVISTGEPYVYRSDMNIPFKMKVKFQDSKKMIKITITRVPTAHKKGINNKNINLTSETRNMKKDELNQSLITTIVELETWYASL